MDLSYLASTAGIVTTTMLCVEIVKRCLGQRAWFRAVPTWVYACVVSFGLTAVSAQYGLLAEPGPWYEVALQAVGMAATASGFWTWLREPNDALQDATPLLTRQDRIDPRRFYVVLLAAALLGGSACALRDAEGNPTPAAMRFAVVSDSFSQTLERLQLQIEGYRAAGLIDRATEQAWQRRIRRMAQAGIAVNNAILAADGATVAGQARVIVELIDELIAEQVIRLSESQRVTVTLVLESLRSAVLIWSVAVDPVTVVGAVEDFDRILAHADIRLLNAREPSHVAGQED